MNRRLHQLLLTAVMTMLLVFAAACSGSGQSTTGEPGSANPPAPAPTRWGYTVLPTSESAPGDEFFGSKLVEQGESSAQVLVWFPMGAEVDTVNLDGNKLSITLVPKEIDAVGAPTARRIKLNGDLPDQFEPVFVDAAGNEFTVNLTGDEAVALIQQKVLSEPGVTAWSLHGYEGEDGLLRFGWRCHFDDGEVLNADQDAIVSGWAMVDAETGELLEPHFTTHISYAGLTIIPDVGGFLGITSDNTLLTREGEDGPVYAISPEGTAEELTEVPQYDAVKDWSSLSIGLVHQVTFETREAGEFGPVLDRITIFDVATDTELDATPPVAADNELGLAVSAWQWYPYNGTEKSLFYVTETPGPSYGDWWTHYQLWEYRLESQKLVKHCTLPTSRFYVMPPGNQVAFDRGTGIMTKELGQ